MSEFIIEAKNILKSYGETQALSGVDFQVEKACCFGFLGPNGAGKTTLMKIIYARTERNTGQQSSMKVFGLDPSVNPREIKNITGVSPQENNLDADLNVTENLLIYSRFFGIKPAEARKRIAELLDFFELKEKANKRCFELSGGMARRLLIARAMINNPKLLILDEPTVGLDPQVRHIIWNKIRKLKESGITVLLTTHYMDEAFNICDKIMLIDKGRKILEGAPRQLLRENMEKYVLEIYPASGSFDMKPVEGVRVDKDSIPVQCYSADIEALKAISRNFSEEEESMIRHSNLEDLFIRLTGRKLNEHQ